MSGALVKCRKCGYEYYRDCLNSECPRCRLGGGRPFDPFDPFPPFGY